MDFFPKNRFCGLDITDKSINFITLSFRKNTVFLEDFNYTLIQNNTADTLRDFIAEHKLASMGSIAAAFTDKEVISRVIDFPVLEEADLDRAIENEIEKYIPFKKNDAFFDYQIIGRVDERLSLFLVAVRKDIVEKQFEILKQAGIRNIFIGSKNTSTINCMHFNHTDLFKDNITALIDVSENTTMINIIARQKILFSRQLSIGMHNIDASIIRKNRIAPDMVGHFKNKINLESEAAQAGDMLGEITDTVKVVLDIMLTEIDHSLRFFSTHHRQQVSTLVLNGEILTLQGIVPYLEKILHLRTIAGDNFHKINTDKIARRAEEFEKQRPYFSSSVGLALRGFPKKCILHINLISKIEKQKNAALRRKRRLLILIAVPVLLVFAGAGLFSAINSRKAAALLEQKKTEERHTALKGIKRGRQEFQKKVQFFENRLNNRKKFYFIFSVLSELNLPYAHLQIQDAGENKIIYTVSFVCPGKSPSDIYKKLYDLNLFREIRISGIKTADLSSFTMELVIGDSQ